MLDLILFKKVTSYNLDSWLLQSWLFLPYQQITTPDVGVVKAA
ncbi:MAG: hypothetical protein JWP94_3352 [Mucilaginibacter sp.]|nr:hypothetical protein [Mucilaginibacter sp.]